MDWMNAVIQGVLLGGLYALFAAGLSLVFGIMRVVNLAHGDFIILAAFLSVVVVGVTGLGPFLSLVIVVPLIDRKSTRLNSSHLVISYAVFCLKKKKH